MSTPIPEPLPNQQPTGTAQKPKPRTTIRRAPKEGGRARLSYIKRTVLSIQARFRRSASLGPCKQQTPKKALQR